MDHNDISRMRVMQWSLSDDRHSRRTWDAGLLRLLLHRHFLLLLLPVALVLRIIAAIVVQKLVHGPGAGSFLAMPDAEGYDQISWQLARYWHGSGPPVAPGDQYLLNVYTYTEAALYFVFGHQRLAMILLNCALAVLTIGLIYFTARLIFSRLAAALSSIGAAFFPSTFVWSVVNLKDAMYVFFVALLLYLLTSLLLSGRRLLVVALLATLVAVGGIRLYIQPLLGLLLAGAVLVQRRDRHPHKWQTWVALTAGCVMVVWLSGATTYFGWTPERLNAQRYLAAAGAQSAFVPTPTLRVAMPTQAPRVAMPTQAVPSTRPASNIETPSLATSRSIRAILVWLPTGFIYALAAPFPWMARRLVEYVTIPEMLLWYLALVFAVVGLLAYWRIWRRWIHLAGYLAGTLLMQALIQGNLGTLVRQRGMLIPFMLIFSGAGLAWLWARWRHQHTSLLVETRRA